MVIQPFTPDQKRDPSVDKILGQTDSELITGYYGPNKERCLGMEGALMVTMINPDPHSPIFAVYFEKASEGVDIALVLRPDTTMEARTFPPYKLSDGSTSTLEATRRDIAYNTSHVPFLNEKMGVNSACGQDAKGILRDEYDPKVIRRVIQTLREAPLLSKEPHIRNQLCNRMEELIFRKHKLGDSGAQKQLPGR
jgi:hypothetical protein